MSQGSFGNMERIIQVRSGEGLARLADPVRLKSDWETLLASRHHLHAPEAARLLDVPEAALVASRIGSGATRLVPDLKQVLAPVSEWGRVLCAFSNACGVHMPLGAVEASSANGALRLSGEHMDAEIDASAVKDAYLFIDSDESHGNTRSVQFFDEAGDSVMKVFIFHKTRFLESERHFERLAHADQSLTVNPGLPGPGDFDAEAASTTQDPDGQPLTGEVREEIASLLRAPGQIELELVGDHARVTWRGAISGARIDDAMFHLHEPDVRSHLRYAPVTGLAQARSGALVLSGDEGRLLRISAGARS